MTTRRTTTRRTVLTLFAVFIGWVAVLASVTLVSDAAPGAWAFFPRAGFYAALPDGAAVVGQGPFWVTIRSDAPGLGGDLYAAGARLVLPAGLTGCLPLPSV